MGIMCVPSKTLCPFSKGCKLAYLVFHRKRLEPKVLPWQQHRRCPSIPPAMHTPGAKSEEHRSNTSRYIPDPVFYCSNGTTHDVIIFLICIIQKRKSLQNEKRYSKKGNTTPLYPEKPLKKTAITLYFIGTLKSRFNRWPGSAIQ